MAEPAASELFAQLIYAAIVAAAETLAALARAWPFVRVPLFHGGQSRELRDSVGTCCAEEDREVLANTV